MRLLLLILLLGFWTPSSMGVTRRLRPGRLLMKDGKNGKDDAKKKEASGKLLLWMISFLSRVLFDFPSLRVSRQWEWKDKEG